MQKGKERGPREKRNKKTVKQERVKGNKRKSKLQGEKGGEKGGGT